MVTVMKCAKQPSLILTAFNLSLEATFTKWKKFNDWTVYLINKSNTHMKYSSFQPYKGTVVLRKMAGID
jgi:hypothetical protein